MSEKIRKSENNCQKKSENPKTIVRKNVITIVISEKMQTVRVDFLYEALCKCRVYNLYLQFTGWEKYIIIIIHASSSSTEIFIQDKQNNFCESQRYTDREGNFLS